MWSLTPIHPGLLCMSTQRQTAKHHWPHHTHNGGQSHKALSVLGWAKHIITLCVEEDERTAAGMGKLEEHSERKQGQQQREEGKYED